MFDIKENPPPLKVWITVSDGKYEWVDIYANFYYDKNGIKVWDICHYYDNGVYVNYTQADFYVASAYKINPKFWKYEII